MTYENNSELNNEHDSVSRKALEIQITEYGQTPKHHDLSIASGQKQSSYFSKKRIQTLSHGIVKVKPEIRLLFREKILARITD